jgi:hypothetical protein
LQVRCTEAPILSLPWDPGPKYIPELNHEETSKLKLRVIPPNHWPINNKTVKVKKNQVRLRNSFRLKTTEEM